MNQFNTRKLVHSAGAISCVLLAVACGKWQQSTTNSKRSIQSKKDEKDQVTPVGSNSSTVDLPPAAPGSNPTVAPKVASAAGGIQAGGVTPLIWSTKGPSMNGWNTSALKSLSGFWYEVCRDISSDSLSPYNNAFQANLGTGHTVDWEFANYGYAFNVIPDTTPLKSIGTMDYGTTPANLKSLPFTPTQYVEAWPVSYTVNMTIGMTVTGSGFKVTPSSGVHAWPIVVGGWYLVNNELPFLYVASVESDTQLTLTAPYGIPISGATLTGPFNEANQFFGSVTDGADHHQIVVTISSSTGLPSKLYEVYGASSPDAGTTWNGSSAGMWDLVTGAQNPEFIGASSAAGIPYWPMAPNYDEIVQGAILHAMPMTVGGGAAAGWGLGAGGFVFPALQGNGGTDSGYLNGGLPLGARVRLKASFDISGFSPTNQIILRAAKKYGFINMDWTSPSKAVQMIGTADARWDANDLKNLWSIPTTQLELVDTIAPRFSFSGPTSVTAGAQSTWTLTQQSIAASRDSNYASSIYFYWSSNGGSTWNNMDSVTATQSNPGPYSVNFVPPVPGSYLFKIDYGGNNWILPPNFAFSAN